MRRFRIIFVASLCMACVHPGLLASAEEPPRLTFTQLVDSIKAELEVTQKIKSYGGKEVEIQGFIIPAGPPDLSFFLLSRVSAMGNYQTPPNYVVEGVPAQRKPPEVRICRLRNQSAVGTRPPSTSTPH